MGFSVCGFAKTAPEWVINMFLVQDESLWDALEAESKVKEDLLDAVDHGIIVSNLAGMLAKELNCEDEFCSAVIKAGMVHDIGKLQIGNYLYGRKEDALAIEEMKYMRMHPTLGYEELKKIGGFSPLILEAVYHHHENYDGSGYPDNLKGEQIPLAARILRTCDVYAALIAERPYRAAFDSDTAMELMIDEVKNFDMKIFLGFLQMIHSENTAEVLRYNEHVNRKIRERNFLRMEEMKRNAGKCALQFE